MAAPMLENPKLLTLGQAVAARAKLRAAGKSLVLTNGVFDLLHTGHLYYLKEARRLGESESELRPPADPPSPLCKNFSYVVLKVSPVGAASKE